MTKLDLQKELLEKVKPGMKPSDLKKKLKKPVKTPKSPPPIEIEQDLGYESDNSIKKPLPESKQIKALKRDVEYWSQTANTHLTNLQRAVARINNLDEEIKQLKKTKPKTESELLTEKNKQIEIIAKENEKNLEKAKKASELLNKQSESVKKASELIKTQAEKIKTLEQTIQDLQTQSKNPAKLTEKQTKREKEPKLYLFTCSICDQNKKSQLHLARVNGLGIDPNKQNKICDTCIRKVDIIKEKPEDFF